LWHVHSPDDTALLPVIKLFSFFPFFLGFSSGILRLQSPIYMGCGFRHDAEGT